MSELDRACIGLRYAMGNKTAVKRYLSKDKDLAGYWKELANKSTSKKRLLSMQSRG